MKKGMRGVVVGQALASVAWTEASQGQLDLIESQPARQARPAWRGMLAAAMLMAAPAAFAQSSTLTTLLSFNFSNGANPYGGLVQGVDGNFYGTTQVGGAYGMGSAYKITPSGNLNTLHSFGSGTDGVDPVVSLAQGTDGNFYGTTLEGMGSGGGSSIFKITPGGAFTNLYTFSYSGVNGQAAYSGLVQGSDGSFYGTTAVGGSAGEGTVFKVTTGGVLTSLVSFTGANGSTPYAGLVQGGDGNFYGTTEQGGANDLGSVFSMTPAGVLTTLYSFGGTDGQFPTAALVLGKDGNFYGTTSAGGLNDDGTVFKITPAGVLTSLASFNGTNGEDPYAGLAQGVDGAFYGTTVSGGASGKGSVFTITSSGVLTSLYSFKGQDGANPYGGLIQGSDGFFYGTTYSGGAFGYGSAFKISVPSAAMPTFSLNGGTYLFAQTVSISDITPGATIYYTTDGSTPTTSSTVYTGPIVIGKRGPMQASTDLQAIAVVPGYAASATAKATFVIRLPLRK